MRVTVSIFVLFICLSCEAQFRVNGKVISHTLPVPPTVPDTARLLIITGQSNANSHGDNLSSLFTSSPLKTLHWDTTAKAFTAYTSVGITTTGFNTQTAGTQTSLKTRTDSIFCIKIAQGSLDITHWSNSNGDMKLGLDSAIVQSVRSLRARGKYVKIISTIWLQGEQDCVIGTSASTYQTRLDSVIVQYRRVDTSMTNTPFIIVKLVEGSGGGTYVTPAATLDVAYVNIAGILSNVTLIRPEDIGCTLSDTVHYTDPSYILIANAWSALIP